MRPYVICHMCTSLDGRIIGRRWGKLPGYRHESDLFERTAASFGVGAWLVGTTTMDEFDGRKGKLPRAKKILAQRDYIANPHAKRWASARTPTVRCVSNAMSTWRTCKPRAFLIYSVARRKLICTWHCENSAVRFICAN